MRVRVNYSPVHMMYVVRVGRAVVLLTHSQEEAELLQNQVKGML